jgi:Zn-finger nucleic acid-binding protein
MEAGTLHCQSCGATVGENDLQCPYCRSQLATVACPGCLGTVSVHARHCPRCGAEIQRHEDGPSNLACPGCKAALFHTSVGGAHLDQCHACGGAWVAQAEFEKLAGDREERGEVLGTLPGEGPKHEIKVEEVHYRPCPACGKFMNRTNYGRTSGVILDVCKDHGLWFDKDELRQVLAFIEGGGLDRTRAREMQELEDKRHQAVADLPQQAWGMGMDQPRVSQTGLLGALVRGLFGF